jgi:hypothetical protein
MNRNENSGFQPVAQKEMPTHCGSLLPATALGIVGAVAGAVIGHFAFLWIARQGFYAIMLPGVLIGMGCGALSKRRSIGLGIFCGLLSLAVGIFTEWRFAPFIKDKSFGFFLSHLHKLPHLTIILIAVGAVFGFWSGMGRKYGAWRQGRA